MIRIALALILLAVSGCNGTQAPEVPSSPKGMSLDAVGTGLDQIDNAVSASVQVAREMNKDGKPDKVESELSVAAASLPKPADDALLVARARADKASQAEYEDQRKKAQAKLAELDKAWSDLEGQVRENKRAMRERDQQIKELKAQIAEAKKDIWTITGAGLVVIGGLAMAFASWKVGAPLLLAGAFCGSIPFIVDSPMFMWVAGGTMASCAGICVWWVFDKVRDNVNKNEPSNPDPSGPGGAQ